MLAAMMAGRTACKAAALCVIPWVVSLFALTFGPFLRVVHAAPPVKRIGVVVDGKDDFYRRLGEQFRKEVESLTTGEFSLQVAEGSPVYCDFTEKCVASKLDELLADDEIDLVVAHGFLASAAALRDKSLSKPVLAPFVVDPRSQELDPEKKRKNLGYLLWSSNIQANLRALDELAPFRRVVVLLGRVGLSEMPQAVRQQLQETVSQLGKQASLVFMESAEQIGRDLPEDTDAVYVGPLIGVHEAEEKKLAQLLVERKIASFSWQGEQGVKNGFLMGTRPRGGDTRLARRFALSMQELLMGETPEPVSARSEDEKTFINRETASALGISPDVSTFLEAEMVGQVPSGAKATRSDRSSAMTLREAVDLALDGNLEIQAADAGVRIVEEDANEARSPLLPQLNLNIGGRIIDGDRALPTNREYQASWGAGLRQVVYDERAWGGFSSAKDLRQAAQEDRERTQLDVIYRVVTSYIELLRVRTILEIQKRDLALSQENLDMARVRQRVGQAGLEEVYRWQTRIADSQRQLLDVQARLQTSRLALNVLVNRPVDSALSPEALSVNSPQLLCSSQTFQDHLTTQNRFQLLAAFLVREGMARAPELKGFDAQIQAVRRQVSAENRSYFIPTVAVEAGLNHRFARGGDGQLPDALSVTGLGANPLDWQVGVSAQLPLFEGALKASRVGRGNAQAGQLSLQKQNTKLVVEQNVRQALYIAAASFATIGITEGAVKAASGNLRIIQEKYQRGRATIIQLLDAQNQSVVAENEAANAVFVFLSDLMRVERAIGRFDFLVTPEEQAQFLRNLAGYQPDQTAVPTP